MKLFIFIYFLLTSTFSYAEENKNDADQSLEKKLEQQSKITRERKYSWGYIDRSHSARETGRHLLGIYGVTWLVYPLSQPDVVKDRGSWDNYKNNFGKLVFDRDEPFWNWFVHPISGSQLFLYYRANGYDRTSAFALAAISSTLFEFTVEIYTEPASVQDLYQTPTLGAVLGIALENMSMYLLNTGNLFGRVMGHFLNPSTLFWFYEGKVILTPEVDLNKKKGALTLRATF